MTPSCARALCALCRKRLGIAALSGVEPVARLARRHSTSRKFVRAQRERAREAVDVAFAEALAAPLVETLPRVSDTWVRRFALGVLLIEHGSYRQVIELLRDLFGVSLSIGTIHAWVELAAQRAGAINRAQDLSGVRVGLHDEIFQDVLPELAGIDAASTCCYLLQGVERRDADVWGVHLLDAAQQGLDPDYTVADVRAALDDTPRSSSVVENLNSRLRRHVFLRRHLGDAYLSLLQFFLNHRVFRRSRRTERVGKSPKQLLTGQAHAHWLERLGFERLAIA